MKVAVCMSGHMRTYKSIAENHMRFLIKPSNADVFIYTSDMVTLRSADRWKKSKQRITEGEWDKDGLYKIVKTLEETPRYPHKPRHPHHRASATFKVDKNKLEKDIRETYGDYLKGLVIEDESLDKLDFEGKHGQSWEWFKNKTWRKVYLCNKMTKKENVEYDLVIRTRPDVFVSRGMHVKRFDPHKLKSQIYMPGIFCDFIVGSSKGMDCLSEIFKDTNGVRDRADWTKTMNMETRKFVNLFTGNDYPEVQVALYMHEKGYQINHMERDLVKVKRPKK